MNKFKWTYIDDHGGIHQVGLMHGAESGNLLIICNSDIVLIDFKVLESKNYSFFIEEELCEIEIERRDNNFLYGFKTDNKADTPLNRARKKLEKKYLFQSLAFLGTLLVIVISATLYLTNFYKTKDKSDFIALLANYHETAAARVVSHEDKPDSYSYIVDGKNYTEKTKFRNISPSQLEHGMPILTGDEFLVKYLPNNPSISEIDFNRPTEKQIASYLRRATEKHISLHTALDKEYCKCLTKTAFEIRGLKGLADFYYQDASPASNKLFNKDSYSRLIKDIPFKEKKEANCYNYK